MGLDLNAWRKRQGLTYDQLGQLIGSSLSQARRYALGIDALAGEALERVLAATNNEVCLYALHRKRLSWVRRRDVVQVKPHIIDPAASDASPPGEAKTDRAA